MYIVFTDGDFDEIEKFRVALRTAEIVEVREKDKGCEIVVDDGTVYSARESFDEVMLKLRSN